MDIDTQFETHEAPSISFDFRVWWCLIHMTIKLKPWIFLFSSGSWCWLQTPPVMTGKLFLLPFRSLRSCAFSGLFGWPIATAFYGPAKRFFTCCGRELGVAKFDATLARMSYEYWRWYMYVQEVFSRYWECISFAVFHIYVIIFMAFHRLM